MPKIASNAKPVRKSFTDCSILEQIAVEVPTGAPADVDGCCLGTVGRKTLIKGVSETAFIVRSQLEYLVKTKVFLLQNPLAADHAA